MKESLSLFVVAMVGIVLLSMTVDAIANIAESRKTIVISEVNCFEITQDGYSVDEETSERVHSIIIANHSSDSAEIIWDRSIANPDNEPYVVEVAFNLDIEPEDVTQVQFNKRYFD